jgi:hypothetical protein
VERVDSKQAVGMARPSSSRSKAMLTFVAGRPAPFARNGLVRRYLAGGFRYLPTVIGTVSFPPDAAVKLQNRGA